jgi:hypothetical protein
VDAEEWLVSNLVVPRRCEDAVWGYPQSGLLDPDSPCWQPHSRQLTVGLGRLRRERQPKSLARLGGEGRGSGKSPRACHSRRLFVLELEQTLLESVNDERVEVAVAEAVGDDCVDPVDQPNREYKAK